MGWCQVAWCICLAYGYGLNDACVWWLVTCGLVASRLVTWRTPEALNVSSRRQGRRNATQSSAPTPKGSNGNSLRLRADEWSDTH